MKLPFLPLTALLPGLLFPLAARAQSPASSDAGLAALEARYAEDRTAALRAGLARYADELTRLQKSLLKAQDSAGAARVQLELDRVLPALGPVAGENAGDEFSMFDETPAVPRLAAALATPADLESLLRALQPAPPAATASHAKPGAPAPLKSAGKGAKRLLKMAGSQLEGTYDPDYGYSYWYGAKRKARWTLSDLPAGSCRLVLRYACDEKTGGGRLVAMLGSTKIEVEVPSTGSWKQRRDLPVGPFPVTDSRADLVLEVISLRPGASALFDLQAVLVIPQEAPKTP